MRTRCKEEEVCVCVCVCVCSVCVVAEWVLTVYLQQCEPL